MADIEKIIEKLNRLKSAIKMEDSDRGKINVVPCISTIDEAIQTIRELQEQVPKWHIIKTRPLTEEEKEYYADYLDEIESMYDCEMPDSDQKVLIATKLGTDKAKYCTDCGCYFEDYEDIDDVFAWMELPKFESEE